MLLDIQKKAAPEADTAVWESLLQKLPPYLYDETGALKEWACNQFEENNEHRHLSHLYGVWPLDETQTDTVLRDACIQAIANRTFKGQRECHTGTENLDESYNSLRFSDDQPRL